MKKSIFIIFTVVIIVIYFLYDNFLNNTIKLGFVAGLSGKYSDLGHSVLNGFNIALDEVAYNVDGKKIQIVIKDDKQNPQLAKKHIEFFKENNISLIVGNTTSSMTKASLQKLKEYEDTFLFSPTASSSDFTKIDDNFFRVQVAHSKSKFDLLSKYLLSKKLKNLYIVYDTRNRSYSNNYLNSFQESFLSFGGSKFIGVNTLRKGYKTILNDIKSKKNVDAVILVANDLDSSKLIQYFNINKLNKQIIISGWAKTKRFLENGGKAIDGTIVLTSYNSDSQEKNYLDFVDKYILKYGSEPSVFSAQGYETAKIILNIIKKDKNLKNFKQRLLENRLYQGLQGSIYFDRYGDVQREVFIAKVRDNKFEKVGFSVTNNEKK